MLKVKSKAFHFDIDLFRQLVDSTKSSMQYLSISPTQPSLLPSDLIALRTDFLSLDCKVKLGIDIQENINKSTNKDYQNTLLVDDRVAEILKLASSSLMYFLNPTANRIMFVVNNSF